MILNNGKSWEFNSSVAAQFVEHAQHHIPGYDRVINKCLDLADYLITKDQGVIDIGCATGYTLDKFFCRGYKNLYGVDNSQAMLDQCTTDATFVLSDTFPEIEIEFGAILSNWTLHFVEDKRAYVDKIYAHLSRSGFAVISEKVSAYPRDIKFYHDWKAAQGLTREEIDAKARSLENIMKPKNIEWWISCFQQTGFTNISIIDADWCFCSFLLQK
jgi:tRNA (cmo5U34)-methyltransferase